MMRLKIFQDGANDDDARFAGVDMNTKCTAVIGRDRMSGDLTRSILDGSGGVTVCRLELSIGGKTYVGTGPDYFEALIEIRRQLESLGVLLEVYGASRNVWPSGMCRGMGSGAKAYRMTLGKQASKTDLVDIFSTGPDNEPATVEQQQAFKNEWFASLR